MARNKGSANLAASLEVLAGAPLDAREVVQAKADLTAAASFPYKYIGMEVYVVAENKKYRLVGNDPTDITNWEEIGSGGGGESIQVNVLPEASADELGKVYQYIGSDDVSNNLYHNFFYECVSDGQDPATYSWVQKDVQPAENPTQVDALPSATPELLGEVLQFIGTTTADYTHNFFYECMAAEATPIGSEDPSAEGWYELVNDEYVLSEDTTIDGTKTYYEIKWVQANVQPGSSGGGSLTRQITAAIDVGGIDSGTVYPVDTPLENILSDLLEPTLYPTLTAPSTSLTYGSNQYYAVGGTVAALTATIALNRGSINPAYGTTGYRSGVATGYAIATSGADTEYSDSSDSSGSFNVPALTRATKGTIIVTGTVNYAAGEQPKDSKGGDYESALPAGSVTANKTLTFIQPYYYGISNSDTVADFTGLTESVTAKGQKTFNYTTNNQYMVFAYDSSYGNLKTILDGNGFDVTGGWTKNTLTVDGFSYFVYVANSPTTDTNAPFTFKY